MKNIKIIVATHKEYQMPSDNIYLPLQVGAEGKKDLGQLGFTICCDVSFDTCAYVARYVTKKKYGKEAQFYDTFNIPPEFSLMSRRPGIGHDFYMDHKDEIYYTDEVFISDSSGGKKFKPPRYYDRLYDLEPDLKTDDLFDKRKEIAADYQKIRCSLTSLSYMDMLKSSEDKLIDTLKYGCVNRKEI